MYVCVVVWWFFVLVGLFACLFLMYGVFFMKLCVPVYRTQYKSVRHGVWKQRVHEARETLLSRQLSGKRFQAGSFCMTDSHFPGEGFCLGFSSISFSQEK